MKRTKLPSSRKLDTAAAVRRRSLLPKKWFVYGSFYVAGLMHNEYRSELTKRGQRVRLVWERSNPVDRNAIAVWIKQDKWRKVGYIPVGHVMKLHTLREEGKSFWCMVGQHDLGNTTDTRMTVVVKVTPWVGAPVEEVEL